MFRFAVIRKDTAFGPQLATLMDQLSESLHMLLLTAADAWRTHDTIDRNILMSLTEDRGEMMERLRRSHQQAQSGCGQVSALFYATSLFERTVWLIRQVGLSLKDREV